jgi:hypothetical protein
MLLQSSSISKEGGAELRHSLSRRKVFDVSAIVLVVEAVMKGVEMCGCGRVSSSPSLLPPSPLNQ